MKKFLVITLAILLITTTGCTSIGGSESEQTESDSTTVSDQISSNESVVSSDISPTTSLDLDIDETKVENIAYALCGAGMVGQSWTRLEGEEFKYNLSLTIFYCVMNPDYTTQIPAKEYEQFIQGYFDVSTELLHEMDDYNADNDTYEVSSDIVIDSIASQIEDFFKIDSIEQENGEIKVSYRVIWGPMAASGDGSDTAYAGYILLNENGDYYHINSVNVTEDNSNKYDS